MNSSARRVVLVWCNGLHYHAPGPCPWSGFRNDAALGNVHRLRSVSPVGGYRSLLSLGLNETEVKRLLLKLFPAGVLHEELTLPDEKRTYARRLGGRWWFLVDSRSHESWLQQGAALVGGTTPESVRDYLAKELGVTWSAVEKAVLNRAVDAPIEVQDLSAGAFVMDDSLYRADEAAEHFRAAKYPMVPPGHLNFALGRPKKALEQDGARWLALLATVPRGSAPRR